MAHLGKNVFIHFIQILSSYMSGIKLFCLGFYFLVAECRNNKITKQLKKNRQRENKSSLVWHIFMDAIQYVTEKHVPGELSIKGIERAGFPC